MRSTRFEAYTAKVINWYIWDAKSDSIGTERTCEVAATAQGAAVAAQYAVLTQRSWKRPLTADVQICRVQTASLRIILIIFLFNFDFSVDHFQIRFDLTQAAYIGVRCAV